MLGLRSFHVLFIALSIVLTAGFGMWGLLNGFPVVGALSLSASVTLVVYGSYFMWKAQRIHLE